LGGGVFVDSLKEDFKLREKMKRVVALTQLLTIVSAALTLDPDLVRKPSKSRAPTAAREIICQLAIYKFGYTGSEVGQFLHLVPTGVSLASRRGEKILKEDLVSSKVILSTIEK